LLWGHDQIVLRVVAMVCEIVEIDKELTVLTGEPALY
jgi:hypothetical protein